MDTCKHLLLKANLPFLAAAAAAETGVSLEGLYCFRWSVSLFVGSWMIARWSCSNQAAAVRSPLADLRGLWIVDLLIHFIALSQYSRRSSVIVITKHTKLLCIHFIAFWSVLCECNEAQ